MRILPVNNSKTRSAFLRLPLKIYRDDPHWIRPFDHEIEAIFDPGKNPFFAHGEAERWIMVDAAGETIGRIAAFINRQEAYGFEQPTGGIGFFECIHSREAAFALFDHGKKWLEARGMEAMDGPINFGEKNNWWGLLIEGFHHPLYGMNYNPRYYQELFEAYGFQLYYKQFTYRRAIGPPLQPIFERIAWRIYDNPDYSFRQYRKKDWKKYALYFQEIYNQAWVNHEAFLPMDEQRAYALAKQINPIVYEDAAIYAFYKGQPIAFFIMIPDLNQIIRHLNGQFNWWAKLKFLYYVKTKACKKLYGTIYGVIPQFQRKGVEAAMVLHADIVLGKNSKSWFETVEIGWLGDFNPNMLKVADFIDGKLDRTFITYRKLFDETRPFKRRPIIYHQSESVNQSANNS